MQDHFETFEQICEQRFQKRYDGFWRLYLREVTMIVILGVLILLATLAVFRMREAKDMVS